MKRHKIFLVFCLFWSLAGSLSAETLFDQNTELNIELAGPIGSLIDNREDRTQRPFRMKAGHQELDVQIRARGNSRLRICDFPPLKFSFTPAETEGTEFQGLGGLKLVTPCKTGERSEIDLLEEYAAYRIFGLLSDVSFRVRLVHFTFDDTDKRIDERFRSRYGFLIEPIKHLAVRVEGQRSDLPAITLSSLDEKQAALVYIFQYLIANTDWSLITAENRSRCCHNIELVQIESRHYLVPYDFDLAGLVSARYARPDPSLRLKNVRKRLYRGFCMNPDVLREAIAELRSKEPEVLGIIQDLPGLSEKEKARQLDYLAQVFTMAGNEDQLVRSFEKKCHP